MDYYTFRETGEDSLGEWVRPACSCGWRGPRMYIKHFNTEVFENVEVIHRQVHNPIETKSFHCIDK